MTEPRARDAAVAPSGVSRAGLIVGGLGAAAVAAAALYPLGAAALAVGVAGAAALMLAPLAWLIPALVLIAPFRLYLPVPGIGVEVSALTVGVALLAVAWMARLLLEAPPRLSRWEWVFVGTWLWMIVSIAWSVQRNTSLRGILQWSSTFGLVLLTASALLATADAPRVASRIFRALLVLVGTWSVVGFLQVALGRSMVLDLLASPAMVLFFPGEFVQNKLAAMDFNWLTKTGLQPFGPFLNAIDYGVFSAVGFGVALAVLIGHTRLIPRTIAWITLILAAAATVAALKATGWSAAVAALIVALLALGRSVRRVLGAVTVGAVLLALFAWIFREALVARIEDLVAREGTSGATVQAISRPAVWAEYVSVVIGRPVTGYGIFTANLQGPVRFTSLPGTGNQASYQMPTENGYLTALVDTGLIGLVGVLVTIGGACVIGVRLSRRYPRELMGQAAGLAAVGIAAIMVGNVTVDGFSGDVQGCLVGVLIGIVVAARRLLPGRAVEGVPDGA